MLGVNTFRKGGSGESRDGTKEVKPEKKGGGSEQRPGSLETRKERFQHEVRNRQMGKLGRTARKARHLGES